ncbi:SCO family protein [Pigmentibacter sp. JX0631]|uniref:SCO family protein n=1 Tax=Pigmentibacter sp. JX0631 TaxID=2976982 RepID=UPI002468B9A3|nr:SCO family protein [Pigmentibacter sp. JX0631]WGL61309.1 SCO family protein [Pigmentibacter sp. JX0631]
MPSQKRELKPNSMPVNEVPKVMQGVAIKENLGKPIDLQISFTDQNNKVTTISEMLADGKPVLLTLNYYRCSTLCSIQLINFAKSLKELGWRIGKDFKVVTISFDPTDKPEDALKKQQEYLNLAGQQNGNWNFYVGSQENIKALTEQIGFYYNYDPVSKEFAHAAAIFFITPGAKISSYLYGISYKSRDIKFSLMDASLDKIGSPTDQILLTCFHYNPTTGKYDAFAMGMMRIAALITVFFLFIILGIFFWREKRKKAI